MRREFCSVLTAFVLAGCATPRPSTPEPGAIDPPPGWRTETRGDADMRSEWWQAFGSTDLNTIVDAALQNNQDIAIAAARISEVMSQVDLAQAQRYPQVDARVLGKRDRSVSPVLGVGEVESASQSALSFSYDTDLFGRLRASSEAAKANLLATRAAHAEVRLTVAAMTAREWLSLRTLSSRLDILEKTLSSRDATRQVVARRVAAGYAASLDLALAEADYRATEQQIPAVRLAIARSENALSVLQGKLPGSVDTSTADLVEPAIPRVMPATVLRKRPDIVEAEERLVAADRSLDASRAAFMPNLQLQGDVGRVTSTLLRHPVDVFSVGASVLAPIFDAGRLSAAEGSALARRDQAAWAYRKTVLTAFQQVEDTLATIARLKEQQQSLETQRDHLRRALTIASNRYRAGYAPFLDELDAQRTLLNVELAISQVQGDQRAAFVSLFQALGGGWDLRDL